MRRSAKGPVTAAGRADEGDRRGEEQEELLKSADPALAAYFAMKKAETTFGKNRRGARRAGGLAGKAIGVGKRRVGGGFVGEKEGDGGAKGIAGQESVSGEYLRDSRFSLL